MRIRHAVILAVIASLTLLARPPAGQRGAAGGQRGAAARGNAPAPQASASRPEDWPMYNRDLAGTRYSPLTQINTTNVGKLTKAWSFQMQPATGNINPAPAL